MATLSQTLAEKISAIVDAEAYRNSFWGIAVADAETGEMLYERNAEKLFIPASTTKIWSSAAALHTFGPDYRFITPIYRQGDVDSEGVLHGNLILRASGDPNLSGRTDPQGHLLYTNMDHTYADTFSGILTGVDPLEGVDDLASQVAASGICKIEDVLVDDRLFNGEVEPGNGMAYLSPVVVNDNVIDVVVTPGESSGAPANIFPNPQTAYAQFDSSVVTVDSSGQTAVQLERISPHQFHVHGQIKAGDPPYVCVARIEQAQDFARTLLVERLRLHGVAVEQSSLKPVDRQLLPAEKDYENLPEIARRVSPPFAEAIRVVLKVSHNQHAGMLPLLLAAHAGKRTLQEGLVIQGETLKQMGVDVEDVSFGSGEGGSLADHVTPRAVIGLLRVMLRHPAAEAFRTAMPRLGVDGTLHDAVGEDSPARGKVYAKTGTAVWWNSLGQKMFVLGKALAGYMDTSSGRRLAIGIFLNNYQTPEMALVMEQGRVIGRVCEAIYTVS
ncbi:MAG: D-alanyl-D-alanine carboxypeptidase/D-alanyl-D-alanine-endopeptidase [Chloroflexi bacterium]|nr:D-alanyl-D-alanine carboxypeptidase/D-alanyl-D-alanine-endopeptidase [Chloroflexota bacterium]